MKRLLFWLTILALLGALGFGGYRYWLRWQKPAAARYRTALVSRGEITLAVSSSGTVQPVKNVQIGSFVSGPIQEVFVDFNSRVTKDQVMAQIDPEIYQSNVARESATVAHRQADVERIGVLLGQAQRNKDRALRLKGLTQAEEPAESKKTKRTYISETEVDQFVTEHASLEAQVKLAKAALQEADANLASAKKNLDFTKIKAPVSGIVTDRKVDSGQTMASQFQTPVMFQVACKLDEKVYIFASVDEADIGLILDAEQRRQPALFTVDAYPDKVFEGTIVPTTGIRLNPTTVQNVVTYTVVVESANLDMKLFPGMTANLAFQIEKHPDVLRIPSAALRFHPKPDQVRPADRKIVEGADEEDPTEGQGQASQPKALNVAGSGKDRPKVLRYVWVLDGEFLAAVEVVTGQSDNKFTELVSGDLQEDQQVVTGVRTAASTSTP